MVPEVRCPKGHVWGRDDFDEVAAAAPTRPVACPYCGALCTEVAEPLPPTRLAADRPPKPADAPQAEFPGYELLGVLGRGGMGIVYKARQIRTDRVVALKVPGHLDLETRVRFTTEARAAARVSHPHVVQVYEVGEHHGRPFLALEYVDGGTLADRLAGAPLPPRPAAALVETVARAVAAAHAHGVVHRDLKPANILLSSKFQVPSSKLPSNLELGTWNLELKVADFGLARRIDDDVGQTRSGVILGTPEYMAPEQATGARGVGPAADIYALGAILYHLLTGRPPFRGTGVLDTLEQVRSLDPVPPRRLQPGVPRDLETICLKCLQKDSAGRYPTAEDMADDLRRFLDGLPVRARPVSRVERWAKRARRNPVAAGLAAGLWLVLIAAAAYGVWHHVRLQAQRDRARYHFQMSVRSIEELLTTEVADDHLDLGPRAELKRKALLEKALAFFDELLQVEPDDPELVWLAARGAVRVGDIHRLLGRYDDALAAYDRALGRLNPLAARPPAGTDATREIAYCHNFIGEVHRLRGDPAAADAAYRRALGIQQPLHDANPDHAGYRQDLSRTHYNLGIIALRTGRPQSAVTEFEVAMRMLSTLPAEDMIQRRHRARVYLNLAPAMRAKNRLVEAEQACAESIALFDTLVAEHPLRPDFQLERSAAIINLGLVRLSARNRCGARASLTQAQEHLERLARDFPHTPQMKVDLARCYNAQAAVAFDAKDRTESAAKLKQAAETWAALVAAHPDTADYHGELGIALANQARAVSPSDQSSARPFLTSGLTELLIGLKANPNEPAFRESLGKLTRDLAELLVRDGDHDAARRLGRDLADALPNRVASTQCAVGLVSACVAATERLNPPDAPAEIVRYEALAVELLKSVSPADLPIVAADTYVEPLLRRAIVAKAVGR